MSSKKLRHTQQHKKAGRRAPWKKPNKLTEQADAKTMASSEPERTPIESTPSATATTSLQQPPTTSVMEQLLHHAKENKIPIHIHSGANPTADPATTASSTVSELPQDEAIIALSSTDQSSSATTGSSSGSSSVQSSHLFVSYGAPKTFITFTPSTRVDSGVSSFVEVALRTVTCTTRARARSKGDPAANTAPCLPVGYDDNDAERRNHQQTLNVGATTMPLPRSQRSKLPLPRSMHGRGADSTAEVDDEKEKSSTDCTISSTPKNMWSKPPSFVSSSANTTLSALTTMTSEDTATATATTTTNTISTASSTATAIEEVGTKKMPVHHHHQEEANDLQKVFNPSNSWSNLLVHNKVDTSSSLPSVASGQEMLQPPPPPPPSSGENDGPSSRRFPAAAWKAILMDAKEKDDLKGVPPSTRRRPGAVTTTIHPPRQPFFVGGGPVSVNESSFPPLSDAMDQHNNSKKKPPPPSPPRDPVSLGPMSVSPSREHSTINISDQQQPTTTIISGSTSALKKDITSVQGIYRGLGGIVDAENDVARELLQPPSFHYAAKVPLPPSPVSRMRSRSDSCQSTPSSAAAHSPPPHRMESPKPFGRSPQGTPTIKGGVPRTLCVDHYHHGVSPTHSSSSCGRGSPVLNRSHGSPCQFPLAPDDGGPSSSRPTSPSTSTTQGDRRQREHLPRAPWMQDPTPHLPPRVPPLHHQQIDDANFNHHHNQHNHLPPPFPHNASVVHPASVMSHLRDITSYGDYQSHNRRFPQFKHQVGPLRDHEDMCSGSSFDGHETPFAWQYPHMVSNLGATAAAYEYSAAGGSPTDFQDFPAPPYIGGSFEPSYYGGDGPWFDDGTSSYADNNMYGGGPQQQQFEPMEEDLHQFHPHPAHDWEQQVADPYWSDVISGPPPPPNDGGQVGAPPPCPTRQDTSPQEDGASSFVTHASERPDPRLEGRQELVAQIGDQQEPVSDDMTNRTDGGDWEDGSASNFSYCTSGSFKRVHQGNAPPPLSPVDQQQRGRETPPAAAADSPPAQQFCSHALDIAAPAWHPPRPSVSSAPSSVSPLLPPAPRQHAPSSRSSNNSSATHFNTNTKNNQRHRRPPSFQTATRNATIAGVMLNRAHLATRYEEARQMPFLKDAETVVQYRRNPYSLRRPRIEGEFVVPQLLDSATNSEGVGTPVGANNTSSGAASTTTASTTQGDGSSSSTTTGNTSLHHNDLAMIRICYMRSNALHVIYGSQCAECFNEMPNVTRLKLGGVCVAIGAYRVVQLIQQVTKVVVLGIDMFTENCGRCCVWVPSDLVEAIVSGLHNRVWMGPHYALKVATTAGATFLESQLRCIRRHTSMPFPRHLITVAPWVNDVQQVKQERAEKKRQARRTNPPGYHIQQQAPPTYQQQPIFAEPPSTFAPMPSPHAATATPSDPLPLPLPPPPSPDDKDQGHQQHDQLQQEQRPSSSVFPTPSNGEHSSHQAAASSPQVVERERSAT